MDNMGVEQITADYVRSIFKKRPGHMHKGDAGRVLIIAGSEGMAGAAVLAARGALRSGTGLVKICAPPELFGILQTAVPEAICVPRSHHDFSQYDAVAIGPGMGVSVENYNIVENVMLSFKGPVVLDADGLNCLAEYAKAPARDAGITRELTTVPTEMSSIIPEIIKSRKGITVLTPHPGEADRLLKSMGQYGYWELGREKSARVLAEITDAIVLLKGADTLISTKSGRAYDVDQEEVRLKMYVNTTGNPGMATGGSGDVLTGIISSLLAQKYLDATPLQAVLAAAYIHGLAGDYSAEKIGEYGMTAVDIADSVAAILKEFLGR